LSAKLRPIPEQTANNRRQIIGSNDLLIAGHARSLGLKLITGNLGEFTRVDGLLCEDWLARTTG
jgi:tRNA(fMet)-specific endonuclease VapC